MERVCRSSVCVHKALSCFSTLNPAGPPAPPAPPAPPKAPAPAGLGTPKGCQRSQIEQQKSVRSKVSLKLSMSRSCCSSKFTLASWLQPILPPWNRCPAQFPSSCPAPQHPPSPRAQFALPSTKPLYIQVPSPPLHRDHFTQFAFYKNPPQHKLSPSGKESVLTALLLVFIHGPASSVLLARRAA